MRKENLSARENRSNRESDARLLCDLKEKPQNKKKRSQQHQEEAISMRGRNLCDHQKFRNGRRHLSIQLLSASARQRESKQHKPV